MPNNQVSIMNKLLRRRKGIEHNLKIVENFEATLQNPLSDKHAMDLKVRLEGADSIYKEFMEIQCGIEDLIPDDQIDEEYEHREHFCNKFSDCVSNIKLKLAKHCDSNARSSSETSYEGAVTGVPSIQNIRLPAIDIPKFSGKSDEWLHFKDTFSSLIHTNRSLSNIQKFHYLRSSLKDEAAQSIQVLEFLEHNYELAWNQLLSRYNNIRMLTRNHIKALVSLPSIRESGKELRCLIETVQRHMQALKSLKQPVEEWNAIIITLTMEKLDKETVKEWESLIDNMEYEYEFPAISEMIKFLQKRASFLEKIESRDEIPRETPKYSDRRIKEGFKKQLAYSAKTVSCYVCKKPHLIYNCPEFLKLSVQCRIDRVKSLSLCFNCLKPRHSARECPSRSCNLCNMKHNSLLHDSKLPMSNASPTAELVKQEGDTKAMQGDSSPNASTSSVAGNLAGCSKTVLLSTVLVDVSSNDSTSTFECRALLDSGAEGNFISEDFARKLNLRLSQANIALMGINSQISKIKKECDVNLRSKHSRLSSRIHCYVLPSLCNDIPATTLDIANIRIPENVRLADPSFHLSRKVDMIIGASLFWKILKRGTIHLGRNKPSLYDTHLGWIVSGTLEGSIPQSALCNVAMSNNQLNQQLEKFWKIEETPAEQSVAGEHFDCEHHFKTTHSRTASGRFSVRIPFTISSSELGTTYSTALRRLCAVERRFQRDSEYKDLYYNFMRSYMNKGYMVKVIDPIDYTKQYFLPHHGVMRRDSLTTKLRVVFDGSTISSTGLSLNDIQAVGPVVQEESLSILLRFRTYKYVMCADITQMYLQINIHPDDSNVQRILFRFDPSETIEIYELKTVTFGTSSAPFLATRSLRQQALEHERVYPEAARMILEDMYVDDLVTGSNSHRSLIRNSQEIKNILTPAGFELRKWSSNSDELIDSIKSAAGTGENNLIIESDKMKLLGVLWSRISDNIFFDMDTMNEKPIRHTKRTVLANIAKLYDPMGLLGPVVVRCKILLQKLWSSKLNWDEELPSEFADEWSHLSKDMSAVNDIVQPRRILCDNLIRLEYHGFCDASQSAYGACIYVKCINDNGNVLVNLVCAKSRVAPMKTQTIPRLELCGALLLSQLMGRVTHDFRYNGEKYYWCDSQVVLYWLKSEAKLLQPFVSNRVKKVQESTNIKQWHYINTKENPADVLSRGTSPRKLAADHLWWNGPTWLQSAVEFDKILNEQEKFVVREYSATDTIQCNVVHVARSELNVLFERLNSLTSIVRVAAYIKRFMKMKVATGMPGGPVSTVELEEALLFLVNQVQAEMFCMEINQIQVSGKVNQSSSLAQLAPFVDDNGILRVGGRLAYSEYAYNKKHPILITHKHPIARLILEREHLRLLHAGPLQMLASSRDVFWITSGRNLAKNVVRKCIRCTKFNPKLASPIQGNLPPCRTESVFPFNQVGVDYAGPIDIKDRRGRGAKKIPCYICVFICMSTKCVHLEAVSDLTTENFISSLRRFVSRRGLPSHIYSDNGRNFVGASRELARFLNKQSRVIIENASTMNVQWHFIPPYSPHMGGLWEAAVKSTKFHLKRVLSDTSLVYEEFVTVLVQIEAILNSRPITPLSSNPNDTSFLTPSHLLIGRSYSTVPDPNLEELKLNQLSRFQYIQRIQQEFWRRWRNEYLQVLQKRQRTASHDNIDVGTLVIIKDDKTPVGTWPMGRVIERHPGRDGVTRVVTIRTSSGIIKRSVKNICILQSSE